MSQSGLRDQRGVAFSEFIISVPFLMVMLFGIVNLGIGLNRYYTINRIAYEGVRYAASIPQLEVAQCATAAQLVGPPPLRAHSLIRDRINILLARNGISLSDLDATYLYTERVPVATLGVGFTRDQVVVRLEVPFNTLFPFVGQLLPMLHSQVSGPYLYTS